MRDKATRQGITETECAPRLAAASSFTNKALPLFPFGYFCWNLHHSLLFFAPGEWQLMTVFSGRSEEASEQCRAALNDYFQCRLICQSFWLINCLVWQKSKKRPIAGSQHPQWCCQIACFCPTNSPKPQNIQFNMTEDQEKQLIFSQEKLEPMAFLLRLVD